MARSEEDREGQVTIAEYERMRKEDGYTAELVRGHVVRSPRPFTFHGVLVKRIARALDEFVERHDLGVVVVDGGAILGRDPDTVRGPDVSFYSTQRIPASGYETGFWGAPDLAVEILSPSNRESELWEKVTDYLDAGVRWVWVFDPPTRSVTVYNSGGGSMTLPGDAVLDGEEVLWGFRLPLAGLFTL